ncbi:MAG: Stk1 family PASTA domain-containing Ser/Thr kinase [Ruminococcus sp.]|nr:Stk1 family PASTA domain-containing Ser/Thr kinase [Ruminococcus sp.]
MLKEGIFLGKRYEILERVGAGGMADVYKSKDHKLNRFVAVKVLKSDYRNDEVFIQKFVSEAQAAAGLMHPNVVNVYDVGQDRGLYYMVMELVEGITLKDYIEKKERLSAKETISIAIQMMTGIQAAHKHHIIHRDIKPQNIIISHDGKVKVTDFGIARATTSTSTISTNVMGSVHYTSPEQARGSAVDEKSDIYSAGITMYEMVTGHVPFDGDSTVTVAVKHLKEAMRPPSEEVPDVPHSLECIILKCTQKNTEDRYQDCQEVITDLKHSLVDPDGDFVAMGAAAVKRRPLQDTETVLMSEDEVERLKRMGAKSRDDYEAPRRNPRERARVRDYDEDDYGEGDEYDEDDYDGDDGYGDDYDEDARRRERRRQEERRRNSRRKQEDATQKILVRTAIGVGAAVVVLVMVLFATQLFGDSGEKEPQAKTEVDDKVPVPDLLGMTEAQARKALNDKNLGYDVSERKPSDKYKEGQIMGQSVDANKKVDKNTTIEVVVSTGEEIKMTFVPNVVGKTEEEAEKLLAEKNLVADAEAKYDDYVEAGKVIESDPVEGTEVEEGTHVKIYVSLGTENVEVPSVEGRSLDDARRILGDSGFNVSTREENHDTVAEGMVIRQSPGAGTRMAKGSTVELTISLGKKTEYAEVPSLYKMTEDQARQALEARGLKLGTVTSQPSDNGEEAGLVIEQEYASGSQLEKGSSVRVILSSGPRPDAPQEEPGNSDDSEKTDGTDPKE